MTAAVHVVVGVLWLVRFPTLLGVGFASAAVARLSALAHPPRATWFVVPLLFYGGAFALNDVLDVRADMANAPWRPIPSGRIGRGTALTVAVLCLLGAVVLSAIVGPWALGTTLAIVILAIWYSVSAKRVWWAKNIVAALLSNAVFVYLLGVPAAAAAAGYLFVAGFLLTLGREMVMDVRDLDGDVLDRRRTVPVLVGSGPTLLAGLLLVSAGVLWLMVPLAEDRALLTVRMPYEWLMGATAVFFLSTVTIGIVRSPHWLWLLAESIKIYVLVVLAGIAWF